MTFSLKILIVLSTLMIALPALAFDISFGGNTLSRSCATRATRCQTQANKCYNALPQYRHRCLVTYSKAYYKCDAKRTYELATRCRTTAYDRFNKCMYQVSIRQERCGTRLQSCMRTVAQRCGFTFGINF